MVKVVVLHDITQYILVVSTRCTYIERGYDNQVVLESFQCVQEAIKGVLCSLCTTVIELRTT